MANNLKLKHRFQIKSTNTTVKISSSDQAKSILDLTDSFKIQSTNTNSNKSSIKTGKPFSLPHIRPTRAEILKKNKMGDTQSKADKQNDQKQQDKLPEIKNVESSKSIQIVKQTSKIKISDKVEELPQVFPDDILSQVNSVWSEIEKKLITENKDNTSQSSNASQQKAYPAIRIFVSSTFTDFFTEREILVKEVFPELKVWCNSRNLDIIECDLRWGVPSMSSNDEAILTCLSEIDRCYDENGDNPFFIGLISERYGWIPNIENLNLELKEKYQWIPNSSITFMEFVHGAFRSKNENACFFIRTPESLNEIPEKYKEKFFDSNQLAKAHLHTLKRKVKQYFPEQTFEFSCKYDCVDDSTGRPRVKLNEYKNFASNVLEFLKKSIEKTYPNMKEQNSNDAKDPSKLLYYEIEDSLQRFYINENLKFFVSRENELNSILRFIKNEPCSENISLYHTVEAAENKEESETTTLKDNRYLLLTGVNGIGKSSLMCKLINCLTDERVNVFYHFFDASANAESDDCMASRFANYFSKELECPDLFENFIRSTSNNLKAEIVKEICKKLSESSKVYCIIIDGLDNDYNSQTLKFFPRSLPSNCTCITSSETSEMNFISSVTSTDRWFAINLIGFDKPIGGEFVKQYLKRYNKKLDTSQEFLLLSKSSEIYSPIWLSFACYELRIFGDFATLTQKIQNLPETTDGLFHHIIQRLNSENENEIIKHVMCLIHVSEKGILENEATKLFGNFKNNEELDRIRWSKVYTSLKPFLRITFNSGMQMISLGHRNLKKIISDLFFENDKTKIKEYHEILSDFYQYHSQNRQYSCKCLCFHLRFIDNKKRFYDYLKSKECMMYEKPHQRAIHLNSLRCMMQPSDFNKNARVYMCATCANQTGTLSLYDTNRNSCYVCGNHVFDSHKRDVAPCLRHYDFTSSNDIHAKCFICKAFVTKNQSAFKPIVAVYCTWCGPLNKCSYFEI